jgi:hypoxanthine phosphoribosyltransferase
MQSKDAYQFLADNFPLRGDTFRAGSVQSWLVHHFLNDDWKLYENEVLERVKIRVAQEGFLPDPEEEGVYRKPKVLFTSEQIENRVAQLANEIAHDFPSDPLVVIGIYNGCTPFMVELISAFPEPMRQHVIYDALQASSRNGKKSTGKVKILREPNVKIKGRNVLIVEGIIGEGLTLHTVVPYLKKMNPKTVKVCALLDKKARREYDVPVDYCGFEAPDEFVIGYGLDINQRYRWLPYIGFFEENEGGK